MDETAEPQGSERERVLRFPAYQMLCGGGLVFIGLTTVLLALAVRHDSVLGALLVVAVGGGALYVLFDVYFVSRMTVTRDGLDVRNPFSTVKHLAWSEVEAFNAERTLRIQLTSGAEVRVWVVQANNIDLVRGRRSYVDDVVDDLIKAQGGGSAAPKVVRPPEHQRRTAALVGIAAGSVVALYFLFRAL